MGLHHYYSFGQAHEVALAYGYDWLCLSGLELLRAKFEHLSSDKDRCYSLYIGNCTVLPRYIDFDKPWKRSLLTNQYNGMSEGF